jgi:hypothetical protein
MLRVDALGEEFVRAAELIPPAASADPNGETVAAVMTMTTNPTVRADALAKMHLGALYAVVEKWNQWDFHDASVQQLLIPAHVDALRRYRHAIFHSAPVGDNDYAILGDSDDIPGWTVDLGNALHDYFRRFHAAPAKYTLAHIKRTGW